ncbi:MAG: succinylglutamate desuccinylase/aspartoacylase family protein [Candidatus Pacebacteria bacterium]|nr:succinylglutamate desuccinylase/aspartoacylase family protein [Candidatus Paceibacterota bacterium]MBP9851250.1 succinylglutamate desuccinylase/aspartoacylase family protein [Candidatus Paceibacterota bacterium]
MNKKEWFSKFEKGYLLKGQKPGPKSVIFAGIHGNEVCGVKAFYEIVPNLRLDSGEVYFVFGNPKAIQKNVRFTEFNINRAFRDAKLYNLKIKKTYEYKRAQYLKKFLNKAETLLDIHSTTNPGSKPFIICEKNANKITPYFTKRFVREVGGFGKIEPGATEDYMNDRGKIGITVECGQHNDPNSINIAEDTLIAFLKAQGHILDKTNTHKSTRPAFVVQSLYLTKTESFTLKKQFVDFSPIKKGAVIGTDGTEIRKSDRDGVIVFAHNCKGIGQEAYILGKKVK